jgi:hypothetical protein
MARLSQCDYGLGLLNGEHWPHQHNSGLPPNKAEAKYNLVSYAVASFS